MHIFKTLNGVSSYITDDSGVIVSCVLNEPNKVETICGTLIPKWQEDIRKKGIPSLVFYPDGKLKTVALDEQTIVATPLGELPAEFITFYPGGEIRRVFPCNGKLSAYWTEEDEALLCPTIPFSLHCGAFSAKVSAIHFYPSGALRSISFWPNETVVIRAFQGLMPARIGITLYENGDIESLEPPYPLSISTPIGNISAFVPDATGIHGESNSLSFGQDGALRSISTVNSRIEVITPERKSIFFGPTIRQDPLLENRVIVVPVNITFSSGSVTLENGNETCTFSLDDCCFRVFTTEDTARSNVTNCGDCSSCNLCG